MLSSRFLRFIMFIYFQFFLCVDLVKIKAPMQKFEDKLLHGAAVVKIANISCRFLILWSKALNASVCKRLRRFVILWNSSFDAFAKGFQSLGL